MQKVFAAVVIGTLLVVGAVFTISNGSSLITGPKPPQNQLQAPSNLMAALVGTDEVMLSWTDNSGKETGFEIERQYLDFDSSFIFFRTVGANITSVSDAGLSPNSTINYRARAYFTGRNGQTSYSSYSNITSVTTPVRELNLGVFASPSVITAGESTTWSSSVNGGTGTYTYSWSGTDGLNGSSSAVVKTYTTAGTKIGMVTVTSGDQTKSASTSITVNPAPSTGTSTIF